MTVQIKKTYSGINPEMLRDEIRDLLQKRGIMVEEAKVQTYALPSGSTQSRVTMVFKAGEEECGSAEIIDLPGGETKLMVDLDERLLSREGISSLQKDLDFILGSYEVKW
ncbi:MAG: hypothetical protein KAW00_03280 [Dehalococcoidia bacterium]|nr:hypothetical protein [Dehalococcoidia bacterium]